MDEGLAYVSGGADGVLQDAVRCSSVPFAVLCLFLECGEERGELWDRPVPFVVKCCRVESHCSRALAGRHIKGGGFVKEFHDWDGCGISSATATAANTTQLDFEELEA